MKKVNYIFLNNKFVEKEKAFVSVLDHGFLYGDGIFETMRSYNGTVHLFNKHIDRLFMAAEATFINIPLSKDDLRNTIYKTLKKNNLQDAYIRLTISRGYGEPGLDISLCKEPTLCIYTKQFVNPSEEFYSKGINIISLPGSNNIGNIKSCNYLNNILAKKKASYQGAQEVIFFNKKGIISEGVTSNIFIVKNNIIFTPSLNNNILPGTTRDEIINISKTLNFSIEEKDISIDDLKTSDECFLTNTGFEIMPVNKLIQEKIWNKSPGKITNLLSEAFKARTKNLNSID